MDLVFSPKACPDLELPQALELAANSGLNGSNCFATQRKAVRYIRILLCRWCVSALLQRTFRWPA